MPVQTTTGEQPLPQGAEPRSYPSRPFVGVGVVVFHDDQVLLVRRGKPPKKNQWSLPGGAQHLGETVTEAAIREVREETGLDVRLTGLLDVVDFVDRDDTGAVRHHYALIDWMAESEANTAKAGDDVTEVVWVPVDALGGYDLWTETERIIRLASQKRKSAPRNRAAAILNRAGVHGRVWLYALLFGLGAYAVINVLILAIDMLKSWK